MLYIVTNVSLSQALGLFPEERVSKRSANSGFFGRFWGSAEAEASKAMEGP